MHYFPKETSISLFERFTDPFRYAPHPLVQKAAELTIKWIDEKGLHDYFSEGKMLGVLVVSAKDGTVGFLIGFSGNAGGRSIIEGFVPPIYDLTDPSGHFKIIEAEISAVNWRITQLSNSPQLLNLKAELARYNENRDEEIRLVKARMAVSKRERDEIRNELSDPSRLPELIRESQFEKAELKRLKERWEDRISLINQEITILEDDIRNLKAHRASMSDELQKWIFSRYIVHNAKGEEKDILNIFEAKGLVPPGGTGECAAPKLLEHAYRQGLRPLAMGEFWYGQSPETAVRTHGHFYPSCTSKCGPLLEFMMNGLDVDEHESEVPAIEIIYEDQDIIAIDKPSGMPSVPGLDGRESAFEVLQKKFPSIYPVHRLDMDTSGILLFAKTQEASVSLRKQFEAHTIKKTYHARLSSAPEGMILNEGDKGVISLPLYPDYDERPRQKVDKTQGKEATTRYEVLSVNEDNTIDVLLHPHTGRTHQLRVHTAHIMGLGRPILGDMLYGGSPALRLHLHASSLTFLHPAAPHQPITISSRSKL